MRRSLEIAALLFAVLIASGLHGYSISAWHRLLDASPAEEILFGEARRIRGDDWFVQIPLAMAERAQEPAFPRVNQLVGFGQDVILPVALPVLHPMTLFRPPSWGWFAGDDFGLAWMWWCHAFGIAIAWACVAWLVTGRRLALAWGCGALVLLAPVLQLTSLGAAPALAATGFGIAGALGVRDARSRAGAIASAALLSYALAWSVRDAIATMAATVYPGARLAEGGRLPLWAPFSNHLAAHARFASDSQALAFAGSLLFFPVLVFGEMLRALRGRGRVDPVACALLALLVLFVLHATAPLPEWLRAVTGLSRVPEGRIRVALAAADALLLARARTRRRGSQRRSAPRSSRSRSPRRPGRSGWRRIRWCAAARRTCARTRCRSRSSRSIARRTAARSGSPTGRRDSPTCSARSACTR